MLAKRRQSAAAQLSCKVMNVTEFAEQIVFGTTLEDKLRRPGRLTYDVGSGSAPNVDSVVSPGRPADLRMRHGPGGAQPPSDDQLENEQARGQLLHFLANHELLATELMALVLLKFPDAPHAFRQGVLVTLQEEQEHTRMYLRRMEECGVEFGVYPVSGQFWRIVEPMQSPIDFVSRLSLTFEQANLDYSLHFASVFDRIGDDATAAILQQIYEDEIGHVQHGLDWFRKWKDPEQSDWQAYEAALEFPMSPQRARGPRAAFNRDGRERAGLTADFIDALEVYRQSRGRSPTIRWFDAAIEAELAENTSPRQTRPLDSLSRDLESVMIPLSRQDDVVLVRELPSQVHRKQLLDAGLELPEFIAIDDVVSLSHRKLRDFSPWAWTPANHALVQPVVSSAHSAPGNWTESQRDLFRKSWSTTRLGDWLKGGDALDFFTNRDVVGIPITDGAEVPSALSEIAARGYTNAIVKCDFATSGRGQRRIPCAGTLIPEDQDWLRSTLSASPTGDVIAIVEPELDRLLDISFLWNLNSQDRGGARYLGWTRPLVSPGRRYLGTRLGRSFADLTDGHQQLKQFVVADRCARLQAVADWLGARIIPELQRCGFEGLFGVDTFVCRDRIGGLRIKPLVEINPRTTMGHVALNLEKRIAPGTPAEFRILNHGQWSEVDPNDERFALQRSPDGRWKSGVVFLSELRDRTQLVPAVVVGKATLNQFDSVCTADYKQRS